MNEEQYRDNRLSALAPEELEDMLASVRMQILSRVKILSKEFHVLIELQKKRERIEERSS